MSESSVKRWADQGRLKIARTAGGHRRIPIPEAVRFVRSSNHHLAHPELLGLPSFKSPDSEDATERLYGLLETGAAREAEADLVRLFLDGHSVAEIADDVVQPCFARLGERWKHQEDGILIEHRATQIALGACRRLQQLLPPPEERAPVAIGGAVRDDPYTLPTLLASCVLASLGWETTNLGPLTPTATFAQAVERHRPELFWVSISTLEITDDLRRDIDALIELSREQDVALALGGRGLRGIGLPALPPPVLLADRMGELEAFAGGLASGLLRGTTR